MKKKTLVIVESPAKSQTISKYLGPAYVVSSSMGHVRDLSPHVLSIDVKNRYAPHYEELKEKKKTIAELRKLAKDCGQILLAPDPDREGEAIAFHLHALLAPVNGNIARIFFTEITKPAILEAVQHPREINQDKVNSQQMRRILDRLAGYKISPVLQKKIGGPLSAGRVQSIALKLIVQREREIEAFVPEEYWHVQALLEGSTPPPFQVRLEKRDGQKIRLGNEADTQAVLEELRQGEYRLDQIRRKSRRRLPGPPLITSTLQQEAYKRFGYSVKKTMQIAQHLYEGVTLGQGETTGLITYMRTDSFRLAKEAEDAAAAFILEQHGERFKPQKPNVFGKKARAQDAHEAIRPTLPLRKPAEIRPFVDDAGYKVYSLIWERFLASQMAPAEVEETVYDVVNGLCLLQAKGEVVVFQGHLAVGRQTASEEVLPALVQGEVLACGKLEGTQHFTKPPARYTEASLVKILEEKGIGRPSTYATIIDTLGKRDYIQREDKKFVPTDIGRVVTDYLDRHFTDLMNYNFTADLEKQLDEVSEGRLNWVEGIDRFYQGLSRDLETVLSTGREAVAVGRDCPVCGKPLAKKYSFKTRGWFVGCTGYPDCSFIEKERPDAEGGAPGNREPVGRKCPQCEGELIRRYSPKTRSHFIGCANYPTCTYLESLQEPLGECPVCGKPLVQRYAPSKRRRFVACSGYPECTYIQPTPRKKAATKGTDAPGGKEGEA